LGRKHWWAQQKASSPRVGRL